MNLIRELQSSEYQKEEYISYRTRLTDGLHRIVLEMDDTSFRVKQHLRQVETYREKLSSMYRIPQVAEQKYVIEQILSKGFWDEVTIFELEQVRDALRDLVRLIEKEQQRIYYTDFTDTILSETEGDANRQAGEKNRGPR